VSSVPPVCFWHGIIGVGRLSLARRLAEALSSQGAYRANARNGVSSPVPSLPPLPPLPARTSHLGKGLIGSRIAAYPDVSFTVVVNPFNGPGRDDLPDENYRREIPKLTCHPNVKVVGYVHTTWAKRDLALVCQDVEKYAQWPEHSGNPGLNVKGVFVDETPHIYDAEAEAYLAKLRNHVKKMPGGDDNVVRIWHPAPPCYPANADGGSRLSTIPDRFRT